MSYIAQAATADNQVVLAVIAAVSLVLAAIATASLPILIGRTVGKRIDGAVGEARIQNTDEHLENRAVLERIEGKIDAHITWHNGPPPSEHHVEVTLIKADGVAA